MAAVFPTVVEVPDVETRDVGLFVDAATEIPESATSEGGVNRTGLGWKWLPHGCDTARRGGLDCNPASLIASESTTNVDVTFATALDGFGSIITTAPFIVVDGLTCSDLSLTHDYIDARLRSRFRRLTSQQIALELLNGSAGNPTQGLSDVAPTITPATANVRNGFSAAEEWLAEKLPNAVGTLHVSPAVLPWFFDFGYVRIVDGQFRTVTGHVVIADAGYLNARGPAGASQSVTQFWMYVTGPVFFQVSDQLLLGNANQESMRLDRNTIERLSTATAIVSYDPCAVAAIRLDTSVA